MTDVILLKKLTDSINQTKEMAKICIGKNHNYPVPNLDYDFLPVGVDMRLVMKSGVCTVMHGGNFHVDGGLIGAGTARVPMPCFEQAMRAYAQKYKGEA